MKVKEIYVSKERKLNIGNYESVGCTYGMLIELGEKDEVHPMWEMAEEIIDKKLQSFTDVWKNDKKVVQQMTKENLDKRSEQPF